MRRFLAFLVAILAAAPAFAAGPANPPYRHEMKSTVEETPLADGGFARKIVQPRFEFFTLWPDTGTPGEPEEIFLEQIFTITYQSNAEGMPSVLTATAWKTKPGSKTRYDTKLWTISDDANEADMLRYSELYRTTQYGCCASENVQRIYDIRNGKLAAVSTVQPAILEVPNTAVRRIVAYHSVAGVVGPPEAEDAKMAPRLLGILTYSSRSEILHRVAVMEAGPVVPNTYTEREPFSPDLTLRVDGKDGDKGTEVSLWSAEKNPISANIRGFRVEMSFMGLTEKPEVVLVPVEKDDFDLEHATVPAGLKLVRLR